MLFIFGKCLHTGHGKLDMSYNMKYTALDTTEEGKDLGIKISAFMKFSE